MLKGLVVFAALCAVILPARADYAIKDGAGATQTIKAGAYGGGILPYSSLRDASGNAAFTAPGVANAAAALTIQGQASMIPLFVTLTNGPSQAAIGSTTSGQTGTLGMGAVTTAAPSYTNAQTFPLSLNTVGGLRVDIGQLAGNNLASSGISGGLAVGGPAASGAAQAGNPVKIGGVFNTTQPTVTNGQAVDAQATARGAQIVATGADGFVVSTTGVVAVNTEGTKTTYHRSANLAITTAGDNFIIQGSGTKTVRVVRIEISGLLTTGSACNVIAVRRSSASSGGTAGTLDASASFDSSNAAATATVTAFTAAPTPGTSAGFARRANTFFPASTASAANLVWEFGRANDQALVLRGTSEFLAVNLAATAAGAGSSINISVEWTEE